jgi:hypothetical protein
VPRRGKGWGSQGVVFLPLDFTAMIMPANAPMIAHIVYIFLTITGTARNVF